MNKNKKFNKKNNTKRITKNRLLKYLPPIPHLILAAFLLALICASISFYNHKYSMQNKINSMTSEERLEYALSLDEDELKDLLNNINENDAKELIKSIKYYEILMINDENSFTAK